MRDITKPYGYCSIDPITMGIGALAGLAGGLFGGGGGGSQTTVNNPAPAPAPPPPPPASMPQGVKPGTKSQQPTFLGSTGAGAGAGAGGLDGSGPIRSGQKSLLGQ